MTQVAVGRPYYKAKRGGLADGATRFSGRAFELVSERMKELEKPA
jgi:hypothetical protein